LKKKKKVKGLSYVKSGGKRKKGAGAGGQKVKEREIGQDPTPIPQKGGKNEKPSSPDTRQ